ncbi:MAG: hypothetical protein M0017_04435, partial [Desulfobacteraceae bacterium]|nr:hypothetical protein [Desulfobacteraceae bacterium]
MFGKEEETGRKILVVDSKGNEVELTEYLQLLDEQGFEIEGTTVLRLPGGRRVDPVREEEGAFVAEGSGEVLRQVKVTVPPES